MGPKLTRSLAVLVGVVAVFGSVCPAVAQNFPPDPLAVRMPDDAKGVYVESVVAIAIRLGVPLGFEEAGALDDHVRGPFLLMRRGKPIVSVRQRPYDLGGMTLREALEAVKVDDRRYEWRAIDGVLVVRPVSSWADPSHPLLTLMDQLNATVRERPGSHWILERSTSVVLLDRGRAVEVMEPVLRVVDEAGEETIPLRGR
jgi:hypothetical protein